MKVIHITAHLGGGVGRVLSSVALYRKRNDFSVQESFICLEKPERETYINLLLDAGIEVHIAPSPSKTQTLLDSADLIQLEWWHHPGAAKWLCENEIRGRLVIWSHTSGLHFPEIPRSLVGLPHAFLVTSPTSLQLFANEQFSNRVAYVSSSGGFEDLPAVPARLAGDPVRFGYLGALNPAKMHPQILDFLRAVKEPEFQVRFWGDPIVNPEFQRAAEKLSPRVHVCGYTESPYTVLRNLDVFVYLLNPGHYGTTENALLEAMAMGAVPVVLNNPVESSIVTNRETGMVVDSVDAFAHAISFLLQNPQERVRMGTMAAQQIRDKFSLQQTVRRLNEEYAAVITQPKRDFAFQKIFGKSPYDWFQSCATKFQPLWNDGVNSVERRKFPLLYESKKSSVFHFSSTFPEDRRLQNLVSLLREDLKP